MNDNEAFRYDEGFTDALNFIRRQIDTIEKLYPGNAGLTMIALSINLAKQSRRDVDKFSSAIIEKLDSLRK